MKRYVPITILIVFWLVFFWRQIVGGEVWYCCDNLLVNIPSKVFLAEELKAGRFPLWNPYIFSGTPFFADINLAVLHPFNLLYLVFPPFRALTVGILILFLAGSTGMYFLGRTLKLGRFASLVGAVVFGFSGSLVVYANNIPILQVAVLVPWVMAAWIRYLKSMTGQDLVMFVLVAAFQFFSGHPQFTYYTWLLLALYSWRRLWPLAKAGGLVLMVSALQLVPFLTFALSSTRAGADFTFVTTDSVKPLSLIRLILPGIVGNLSGGTAWIQAGTIHGYVGFLPLLLAPLAWTTKIGRFFLTIAVVWLLMAMGKYTPVYWLAYHIVPGIAWFREPVQTLFLWGFGIAGAAMVAVESLLKKPRSIRYLLVIGIIFLMVAGIMRILNANIVETMVSHVTSKAYPSGFMQELVYNLAFIGAIGILGGIGVGMVRERLAKIMVLGVLFADLYVYGQTNVTTLPEATVVSWQKSTQERVASWKLSGQYRYYTDPAIYPYPDKVPFGQFNDPGESAWQFKILRPTTGMLYGVAAVDGYASMVPASYQRRFGEPERYDPTGVVIPSIIHPLLPKLGVRYIITRPHNPLLGDTTRFRLLESDGVIAVYEDSWAIPITSAEETVQ
ncbi:hypothetical protein HY339_02110 [Candidatus Gottesmanbacteria bacterium]|nr:hypothetical protein [Candidatus Gottesmanbacteria bacterium]